MSDNRLLRGFFALMDAIIIVWGVLVEVFDGMVCSRLFDRHSYHKRRCFGQGRDVINTGESALRVWIEESAFVEAQGTFRLLFLYPRIGRRPRQVPFRTRWFCTIPLAHLSGRWAPTNPADVRLH